ncbi:MAG: Mov34/MPN/PAD-1 family protein [Methanobacteriota archaeon]
MQHVHRIRKGALEMILAGCRDVHPMEFNAVLRAEGDTVTELLLVPGSISGEAHAFMMLYNLPIDSSLIGTVHGHPGGVPYPSDADLQLFRHFGHTHLIVAEPYTRSTWRAFDMNGREIRLEVVA